MSYLMKEGEGKGEDVPLLQNNCCNMGACVSRRRGLMPPAVQCRELEKCSFDIF